MSKWKPFLTLAVHYVRHRPSCRQHEVSHFTQHTSPAFGERHQAHVLFNIIEGIGRTCAQSRQLEHRQVVDVVADKSNFLRLELIMPGQLLKRRSFVENSLVTEVDLQFRTAFVCGARLTTGDSANDDPFFFQVADDLAVLHIEVLDLFPRFIVNDPAIGQNTVDIEEDRPDAAGFFYLVFGVPRKYLLQSTKIKMLIYRNIGRKLGKAFYFKALYNPGA